MAGGGLQGVDGRELVRLHDVARHLAEDLRKRLAGDWRAGLDARGRAAAALVMTNLSTRLMEAVNWLLTAQAVAAGELADPGPAAWRAGPSPVPSKDALAVAVERLYRRIIELDTEAR